MPLDPVKLTSLTIKSTLVKTKGQEDQGNGNIWNKGSLQAWSVASHELTQVWPFLLNKRFTSHVMSPSEIKILTLTSKV